jgi:hypothetical protein
MNDDFLKIVGIIIVSFFIVYIVVKLFRLQTSVMEGLTNPTPVTSSSNTIGAAGAAAAYSENIKANLVKLQDELLINKYRKDYESAIINLDDYIGHLMIQQTLNIKQTGDIKDNIEAINNLNILKNAKESLNATMAYLDKQ